MNKNKKMLIIRHIRIFLGNLASEIFVKVRKYSYYFREAF